MKWGEHVPVLYNEIITALRPRPGTRYIDGTVGAAGHAIGILEAGAPDALLLGIDRDPEALDRARTRLAEFGPRARLRRGSYAEMAAFAAELGWDSVDGIVLDLGLSSLQLASAERGFAFRQAGPLDMRFGPDALLTAADIVNGWDVESLAAVLWRFGEERKSRRVARAIVAERPIRDTQHLAEVVAAAVWERSRKRPRVHPATRTFQALRIAVNDELEVLKAALPAAIDLLVPGGRLAVIAFHSLEDRIVKRTFRGHPLLREIRRKPIRPGEAEVEANPRSRSARLRVVERGAWRVERGAWRVEGGG